MGIGPPVFVCGLLVKNNTALTGYWPQARRPG